MTTPRSSNDQKKSNFRSFILIFLIIILGFGGYFSWNKYFKKSDTAGSESPTSQSNVARAPAQNTNASIENTKPKIAKPDKIRLNTLFFGDVFWGRYVDDWSKASPLKYTYPFSGLNTFEREKYDIWIADMECPITDTYIDSKTQDSKLEFSCPTEYTPEAAKWFNAFTLDNNHTGNMEKVKGLEQTRNNLEKNGIQYFGNFDNAKKEDICEITSFKVTPIYADSKSKNDTEYYIPLALCGYHNIFKLPTQDELNVIKQYSQYLPTIIMPHQGKEYTYKADSLQTSYYRQMIDLGADAVIGDHVHSVQNTEAYKGKLIIYSLGNFIFDQQKGPQVTQATGANLNFSFEVNGNLEKWLELSKSCQKFKDDCLEKAKEMKLEKPKFSIQYHLVCSDNSGKLAKKASQTVCQNLYKLTNWEKTKAGLNK